MPWGIRELFLQKTVPKLKQMCYDEREVKNMEQEREVQEPMIEQQPQQGYKPRPSWQVWLARIGLVVFLLFLVIYYATMFLGGGA